MTDQKGWVGELTVPSRLSRGKRLAQEIGTFSLKMKGPTPREVTGKYLVVWEKVGTDWKLSADIWNDGK
jgi:ketosteroid isomerase-like protein